MDKIDIYELPYGVALVVKALEKGKLEDAANLLQDEIKRKAPAKTKTKGRPAKATAPVSLEEDIDAAEEDDKPAAPVKAAKKSKKKEAKTTAKPKKDLEVDEDDEDFEEEPSLGLGDDIDDVDF